MITQQELQTRLDRTAADFHLPGAAIALVQGGQTVTGVTGNGVPQVITIENCCKFRLLRLRVRLV